jgi:hypothetical protein
LESHSQYPADASNPVPVTILCVFLAFLSTCGGHHLEKTFFAGPAASRVERSREYSLPDQYKIFRYGNDQIEPPAMQLALPIAERGRAAVPFLTDQLKGSKDDVEVRDILLIFERMDSAGRYMVHAHARLMKLLDSRVSAMKDQDWRATCTKMLQRIKANK